MTPHTVPSQQVETALQDALTGFPDAQVWVGFSGGLDSTALLLAAKHLQQSQLPNLQVTAIHVNHNLHAHSSAWAHHCAQVCTQLDVPLIQATVQVPALGNLEANARRVRYAAYAQYLPAGGVLLLGHHQQDQSETILYRLLQGRGMLTIRPQGHLGSGHFLRPFLNLSRPLLSEYVQVHDLSWVEDPSNADTDLHRNFLRADILPRLKTRWGTDVDTALSRVAHHHQNTLGALTDTLSWLPDEVPLRTLPMDSGHRRAWLRAFLASREVFAVSDRGLDEFISQQSSEGLAHLQVGEVNIYSYDGTFYFEARPPQTVAAQPLKAPADLALPYGTLHLRQVQQEEAFAFSAAQPLKLGFRRGGETLQMAAPGTPGQKTFTKSLKQLFNDARVPPWRRSSYPLIFAGDTLVCVPDIAVAQSAAETPDQGNLYWQAHFEPHLAQDKQQSKK